MEFQFSFGTKYELIVIDGLSYINNIGALLQCVIDIDWPSQQKQLREWEQKEFPKVCWKKQISKALKELHCHPVITYYLETAVSDGTIKEKIGALVKAKEVLLTMLETIVDEEKSNYDARLYERFYEQAKERTQALTIRKINGRSNLQSREADTDVLSDTSRRTRFETEDITAMLCMELRQLCIDQHIIRKCANCRRFFWTRITKKIYCSRIAPGRATTCSQYGPRRKRQIGKRPAFNLYWKYRTEAFQRMSREKDSRAFQAWVKATQPYKEAARRGEISVEEMKRIMEKTEIQVFPARP